MPTLQVDFAHLRSYEKAQTIGEGDPEPNRRRRSNKGRRSNLIFGFAKARKFKARKSPNKIAVLSNLRSRCSRSPTIERLFRRPSVENGQASFATCRRVARVGVSVRRALFASCGIYRPCWHTRPTSWHSRTALPRAMEGESAPALDVGAQLQRRAHQRGAEMTRSRAGSPTRATRRASSYQHLLPAHPALP
jgi:hypothetical protein